MTFGDYSGSGHPDIVFGALGPRTAPTDPNTGKPTVGAPDTYLRREGALFYDRTTPSGLTDEQTRTLVSMSADLDEDGLVELIVGTDEDLDRVLSLGADGRFTDRAAEFGMTEVTAAMGFAVGDIDGDGDMDLFLTDNDSVRGHKLYVRQPDGRFAFGTAAAGLEGTAPYTGWGVLLEDFDNDGDLDLFIVNGGACAECDFGEQQRLLYWNDGGGHFTQQAPGAGTGLVDGGLGRAALASDVDQDGDLDILVTDVRRPATLLRNDFPTDGHWIQLRLVEPDRAPSVGAVVTVRAGGRTFRRWVVATPSYGGSSSGWIHIGLGAASSIDALSVRWLDGATETPPVPVVDTFTVLHRSAPPRVRAASLPPLPTNLDCETICDRLGTCGSFGGASPGSCPDFCSMMDPSDYPRLCLAVAPCKELLACLPVPPGGTKPPSSN